MNWIAVAIAQAAIAWFAVPYIPFPPTALGYLSLGLLTGVVVGLVGLAAAVTTKSATRQALLGLAAAVVCALLVAVFIEYDRSLAVDMVLNFFPYWFRRLLIVLAAVSGYWALQDRSKLPFEPAIPVIIIVAIFGAVIGALVGAVVLHAILPPGSYPRFLIAIPILVGGALGLALGAGPVHVVLYPFGWRMRR